MSLLTSVSLFAIIPRDLWMQALLLSELDGLGSCPLGGNPQLGHKRNCGPNLSFLWVKLRVRDSLLTVWHCVKGRFMMRVCLSISYCFKVGIYCHLMYRSPSPNFWISLTGKLFSVAVLSAIMGRGARNSGASDVTIWSGSPRLSQVLEKSRNVGGRI